MLFSAMSPKKLALCSPMASARRKENNTRSNATCQLCICTPGTAVSDKPPQGLCREHLHALAPSTSSPFAAYIRR